MKTKVSKTFIWLILFGIIIVSFVFIFLDETCTFHMDRLIEIPTKLSSSNSKKSSNHPPTQDTEHDEQLIDQNLVEIEARNNLMASRDTQIVQKQDYV